VLIVRPAKRALRPVQERRARLLKPREARRGPAAIKIRNTPARQAPSAEDQARRAAELEPAVAFSSMMMAQAPEGSSRQYDGQIKLRLKERREPRGIVPLLTSPSLPSACSDQLSLELSQAAEHGQHLSPVRSGRIRPGVVQRLEARLLIGYRGEGVHQVAG
jgi:hypothetical protein